MCLHSAGTAAASCRSKEEPEASDAKLFSRMRDEVDMLRSSTLCILKTAENICIHQWIHVICTNEWILKLSHVLMLFSSMQHSSPGYERMWWETEAV